MATEIRAKYSASAALTITLASLASSANGATARQSTFVDNSSTRHRRIHLYASIKHGTSPTISKGVFFWLLKGDGTVRTDGAGPSDAGLTIKNAEMLGVLSNTSTTTGEVVAGHFTIQDPGPEWAVAVGQDSGTALDSTPGNQSIRWVGETDEIQ
jgi:hypothetical protein